MGIGCELLFIAVSREVRVLGRRLFSRLGMVTRGGRLDVSY